MICPHCGKGVAVEPSKKADAADMSELATLIDKCSDMLELGELGSKAADFVATTKERYEKYGSRIYFSDKQMAFLKSIATGGSF